MSISNQIPFNFFILPLQIENVLRLTDLVTKLEVRKKANSKYLKQSYLKPWSPRALRMYFCSWKPCGIIGANAQRLKE